MTSNEIQSIYKQAINSLSQGKLKYAFERMGALNAELKSSAIHDTLNGMEENYRFMLQYFLEGVQDGERKSLFNKLVARLFSIGARLRDELLTRDSSNFEFTQKRYFPFTSQPPYSELKKGLMRMEDLVELGDFNAAEAAYRKCLNINPDDEDSLRELRYIEEQRKLTV